MLTTQCLNDLCVGFARDLASGSIMTTVYEAPGAAFGGAKLTMGSDCASGAAMSFPRRISFPFVSLTWSSVVGLNGSGMSSGTMPSRVAAATTAASASLAEDMMTTFEKRGEGGLFETVLQ